MDSIDGSIRRRVSIFHEKRYVSGYDPEFPGSRQLFNGSLRFEREMALDTALVIYSLINVEYSIRTCRDLRQPFQRC
jgi:hypothetical protein